MSNCNTVTIETVGERYMHSRLAHQAAMRGMDKDEFIRMILDELKQTQDTLTDRIMNSIS
jgi:hypothetical protein